MNTQHLLVLLNLVMVNSICSQSFTEKMGTPFDDIRCEDISFSDVDGDGDVDLFFIGSHISGEFLSELYLNDGQANYVRSSRNDFIGLSHGCVEFADIDGDGDNDLFLSGSSKGFGEEIVTKFYSNDGFGVFVELENKEVPKVWSSDVVFMDVDGDQDLDMFLAGAKDYWEDDLIASIYINDDSGQFSEVPTSTIIPVSRCSAKSADVDADGDMDLFVSGRRGSNDLRSRMYINDGSGTLWARQQSLYEGMAEGDVEFSDIDNDGDMDLFVTGKVYLPGASSISNLYINDGLGYFSRKEEAMLQEVNYSAASFGDVDNDGDDDLIVAGSLGVIPLPRSQSTRFYINDVAGSFLHYQDVPFEGVYEGDIMWNDLDNDGDLDLFLSGVGDAKFTTKIYLNDLLTSSEWSLGQRKDYDLEVFPNPVVGDELFLQFDLEGTEMIRVTLSDPTGRCLIYTEGTFIAGQQALSLELSAISAGTYILTVGDGTSYQKVLFIRT